MSQGKRAERLLRNPTENPKGPNTPTHSLLQAYCQQLKPQSLPSPGSPSALLPCGYHTSRMRTFLSAPKKEAGPARQGGEDGFHHHCSRSEGRAHNPGGAAGWRPRVCLSSPAARSTFLARSGLPWIARVPSPSFLSSHLSKMSSALRMLRAKEAQPCPRQSAPADP